MNNKMLENQDWFKLLTDNSGEVISIHDKTGKILFVSQGITSLLGINPQEYTGQMPWNYVNKDDCSYIKEIYNTKKTDKAKQTSVYRMKNKAGNDVWVESRTVSIPGDDQDSCFITFSRSIDDQLKAKEAINNSKELLDKAQKISRTGTFKWNIKTGAIEWSDELYKIHGYNKKDGPPDFETFLEHVHKEDREKLIRNKNLAFKKLPYSCDYRIYDVATHELKYFHSEAIMEFDENNEPFMFIGSDQDITQRKRMENALFESEQKYRTVVETAQDMIFIISNGIIVFVNEAILRANKAPKEEILGRSFLDFVAEEEKARITKIYKERLINKTIHLRYEMKARLLSGDNKIVEINSSLITYEGKDAVLVIMHDITNRKNVENALIENEKNFRKIFDNDVVGITLTEYSGKIIDINRAMCTFLECNKDQLLAFNIKDFFVNVSDRKKLVEEVKQKGKTVNQRVQFKTKGNLVKCLDVSLQNFSFHGKNVLLAISKDVTVQMHAEQLLKESEERYRNIVELSPDGIVSLNTKGKILSVNKAFCRLSGYGKDDFIGKNPLKSPILAGLGLDFYSKMLKNILTGNFPRTIEFRWKHKNGMFRVGEALPSLIKKNNQIKYIQIIVRDITERKENEIALKKSEERYRTLFENSSDPTLIIENYKFILCNETTVSFLGYKDKSDIEGKAPWELSPPGQPDDPSSKTKAIKMMDIAVKNGSNRFEWIHTKANGEQLWIDVALTYMPSTQQIYTVWRDITDRKNIELAIDKLEESTFATYGIDFIEQSVLKLCESLACDFVFVGRNDDKNRCVNTLAVCEGEHLVDNFTYELKGTPCEKVIDTGPCSFPVDVDFQFPEDSLLDEMGIKAYIGILLIDSNKNRIGLLVALFRKNLESVDFIEKILQIHAYRVASEIERMDSLRELQNSEERWRSLGENAPGRITLLDKNFVITFINKVDSGYTKEMFLNRNILDFYTDNERSDIKKILYRVLKTGNMDYFENKYIGENGMRWFSNHIGPVFQDGLVENLIIFSTDITESKKIKDELDNYREHLEELVKGRTKELLTANKELETFSYSVSHDLRAPLRHINAFSALLRDSFGSALNKKQLHYFETIISSSNRMSLLIDDILSLSRVGRHEIQKEKADFNRIIMNVREELEHEQQGRQISWSIDRLPPVMCDSQLLYQVWSNLISNALKYTRKNKVTEIKIGFLSEKKSEITFFIHDNGAGFNPDYQDRIFGVFQRLHPDKDYEGTGIGLAIVHKIIDRHGGSIRAEGTPGKGASFYFTLPLK